MSDFNAELGRLPDKPFRDVDDLRYCNRQPQTLSELPGEHFIRKNPDMLRIVCKFCDVATAVGGYKKVGLRSPAELSKVLDCGNIRTHSFTPVSM